MSLEQALSYREKTHHKAQALLQQLLPKENAWIKTVLIIGAGSFPSYAALQSCLQGQSVHFVLVEPNKKDTDFFLKHFAKDFCTIINTDIKTYLTTSKDQFDLIYYEHPETMTLPLVLGQLGIKNLKRVALLRESFAYIARVLKPQSVIIASCMSKHECTQLKNLLNFNLKISTKTSTRRSLQDFFYGGPYSAGLSAHMIALPECMSEHKKEKAIQQSNLLLVIFLLLGLLSYIFYCYRFPGSDYALTRFLMVMVLFSQLYFHQLGTRGFLIKIFLFLLQIAL